MILVEGDPILFNPYGVMAVNPNKNPQINNQLANQFIDWLISLPTQEKIREFGTDRFGAPLFTPDSSVWREVHRGVEDPTADVALRITGKVGQESGWSEDEVKAMEILEAQSTNNRERPRPIPASPSASCCIWLVRPTGRQRWSSSPMMGTRRKSLLQSWWTATAAQPPFATWVNSASSLPASPATLRSRV